MVIGENAIEKLKTHSGECWCLSLNNVHIPYTHGYKDGFEDAKKDNENIKTAMETIKNYCIKIIDENGNCKKCVFCSKGYNGCKLQTAPIYWEVAE